MQMTTTPVPYIYSKFIYRRHELEKYIKEEKNDTLYMRQKLNLVNSNMKQSQHKIRIEHNSSI